MLSVLIDYFPWDDKNARFTDEIVRKFCCYGYKQLAYDNNEILRFDRTNTKVMAFDIFGNPMEQRELSATQLWQTHSVPQQSTNVHYVAATSMLTLGSSATERTVAAPDDTRSKTSMLTLGSSATERTVAAPVDTSSIDLRSATTVYKWPI